MKTVTTGLKEWAAGLLLVLTLLWGGSAQGETGWSEKYPIAEDIPGPYSYSETSKKDYAGITLNVLTHAVPVMGEPTKLHARQFEELTGAEVVVHHVPWGELYEAVIWGLKNNQYDVVISSSLWLADIAEYLEPLPKKMFDSPQFKDVIAYYKGIARQGDNYFQVPIDGDRHYLQYRSDLLNDPAYRKEFKRKYGRELSVPSTWKEFRDVAEFFNGRQLANGTTVFGAAEITNKDDLLFSQFCKRATSYAKHPKIGGGFYFDLETMKPLINTPGFVAALDDFVAVSKFYPPGAEKWGLWDVIKSFGSGQVVFSDSWDDAFIQAMELKSPIRNQVAASLSPGSKRVWNRRTGQWDDFPVAHQVPYIAGGWTSSVAKTSRNKDAAFDYLGFFGNEANHASDLLIGRYGVNPFRYADLDKDFWIEKAGWDEKVARSYVETFKRIDQAAAKVPDLRIYSARQYVKVLAIGVSRALTGRSTSQEALDYVAEEWAKLTEAVGIEKQREAYSHLVRMEDEIWSQYGVGK
jgi:multiple sugar transport system substrate-binding protein